MPGSQVEPITTERGWRSLVRFLWAVYKGEFIWVWVPDHPPISPSSRSAWGTGATNTTASSAYLFTKDSPSVLNTEMTMMQVLRHTVDMRDEQRTDLRGDGLVTRSPCSQSGKVHKF
jgi:hypothetical protein